MSIELKVPELGENVDQGDVTRIMVALGDLVSIDQPLLELETGKASVEMPADQSGTVSEILVSEGDKVNVGQVVIKLEGVAATAEEEPKQVYEPAPIAAPTPTEFQPHPVPGFAPRPTAKATPAFTPHPVAKASAPEPTVAAPAPAPEPAPAPVAPAPAAPPAPSGPTMLQVPELGENVESGDITRVLVSVGDVIKIDQALLEIETGKASVEVPATSAGKILEVLVSDGEKVTVGQDIVKVDVAESAPATPAPAQPAVPPSPAVAPAPIPPNAPPAAPPVPATEKSPALVVVGDHGAPIPAGPGARKFAREIGIELAGVAGTGPRGRITIDDIKQHSKSLHQSHGNLAQENEALKADLETRSKAFKPAPLPDFSKWGDIKREKMSTIRRITAEHMSNSWNTIPHVTQHGNADITELEGLRKRFSKLAEKAGGKLTPTAILLKVAGSALKVFPEFVAAIDMDAEEIIYKDYIHIGVAVDTPKGLLVPVIRDVDKKNIIELSVELTELALKAREGKISPSDLQGGCFTISNLGGIGGTHFTPIVNYPEVAILGIGRGSFQAVYTDGEFEPRMMLPLSLSYDHRLIDGALGARFLHWFCEAINEPMLLALEG